MNQSVVPIKIDGGTKKGAHLLEELKNTSVGLNVVDTLNTQLEELFFVRNPALYSKKEATETRLKSELFKDNYKVEKQRREDLWFYYPWRHTLIHALPQNLHYELRTARNKQLITEQEQQTFRDYKIGIAGLSVGNSAAITIAVQGGCQEIKLADGDEFSLSNTNRVRASLADLGSNKAEISARQIYELDPYAKVHLYTQGLTEDNIESFFSETPKLQLVIDEMDNLELKIKLRLLARKLGVPVMMASDNHDSVILDIERFDLDQKMPIFHGLVESFPEIYEGKLSLENKVKLSSQIIGVENISERMQESLGQIGKTIPTWPQLANAAFMAGGIVSLYVRKLAIGEPVKSGRKIISV